MPEATLARSKALAERIRLLAAAVALACAAGCGDGDRPAPPEAVSEGPTPAAEPPGETGSLSFALTVPRGVHFETFHYVIIGPAFSKSDAIDLTSSTTVSALVEGIPAGPDYTVTLMGTTAPPTSADCSGSQTFTVVAGRTVEASVAVACHVVEAPAPPPNRVPIPALATFGLGFALLGAGTLRARRSRSVRS